MRRRIRQTRTAASSDLSTPTKLCTQDWWHLTQICLLHKRHVPSRAWDGLPKRSFAYLDANACSLPLTDLRQDLADAITVGKQALALFNSEENVFRDGR